MYPLIGIAAMALTGVLMAGVYKITLAARPRTKYHMRLLATVALSIALASIPAALLFPGPASKYSIEDWTSSLARGTVPFGAIFFILLPLWLAILGTNIKWLQKQHGKLFFVGLACTVATPIGLIAALVISSIQAGAGL